MMCLKVHTSPEALKEKKDREAGYGSLDWHRRMDRKKGRKQAKAGANMATVKFSSSSDASSSLPVCSTDSAKARAKAKKREKVLRILSDTGKAQIFLDIVCEVVFKEFIACFQQASRHLCSDGSHCSSKYYCKFTGIKVLCSFENVVKLASVNRDCRRAMGAIIQAAQESRLVQFRKKLQIWELANPKLAKKISFPGFLPSSSFTDASSIHSSTHASPVVTSTSTNKDEDEDSKKKVPEYIPLFKAVFGILWKFGDWQSIFADKVADHNKIPAMSNNGNIPKIFS